MARRVGRNTSVRGIQILKKNEYRVRGKVKVGRCVLELDRVIRARSVQEAVAIRLDLLESLRNPIIEEKRPETVAEFAQRWAMNKKTAEAWTPKTLVERVRNLDLHILPFFGDMLITEVTTQHIEEWRAKYIAAKKHRSATINGFVLFLRQLFGRALLEGLVERNPAAVVELLPETDRRITQDEPNALEPHELARFLDAALRLYPQHFPMILTLACTAARKGVVYVLRDEDIDFEKGRILARRRLSDKEIVEGVKRNRIAYDILPMPDLLAKVLRNHLDRRSPVQKESGFVFSTRVGGIRSQSLLNRPFVRLREAAKIEIRFTPHGCRRTANDFYRKVASEVVTMSITGHRTKAMHNHYSTVRLSEKQRAAEAAFRDVFSAITKSGDSGGD